MPLLDVRRLTKHVIGVLGGELGLGLGLGDVLSGGPDPVPAAAAAAGSTSALIPGAAAAAAVPTSFPTSALAGAEAGLRKSGREVILDRKWRAISTLDDSIDAALGGGIPTGYITEITGERYEFFFFYVSFFLEKIFKSVELSQV